MRTRQIKEMNKKKREKNQIYLLSFRNILCLYVNERGLISTSWSGFTVTVSTLFRMMVGVSLVAVLLGIR